ncbi:MFS transporter [Novosphingobium mangrovi (ex Huang et al. 2023)]|uniref:MFS transporter n=1 Tax=Novosphingobium mangrovi (ex Huang et al. 2023) TaxID=2976432 RepID=A0ABT2I246_9SPHN|nr:MFS transporter [Novosphingobium mangrovi (ex Huang et al. 2023)]MCT2398871.1 MFS transporter [Novosphingobium mangrovi (ex Huang et al. 2023)]
MAHSPAVPEGDAPNHPLAVRMGVIAGVSHNIVIGTIMGSFGLMLASIEQRLGVSGEEAAIGIPLVLVGSSILAPFVGVLIARFSLRLLLMVGALLTVAGYFLLAFTNSYAFYLIAYGLCFGPAMSLAGSIGPATLVTRWFHRNRGLALGIVHLPVVIAIVPWTLERALGHYAPTTLYAAIGTIAAVLLVPLILLTVDHPPSHDETLAPEPAEKRTADGSFSIGQLLARPRFWALCLAGIASMTSSVLLGSLLVPMGVSWGFSRPEAALLQSIMSLVGIAGSVLFGWVADKLGGGRSLALIGFNCAVLWLILLQHPPFTVAAIVIGLIGMHGAGAIPTLGRGLSDTFGQASYSRGFGLNTLIGLPFIALGVVGSARVFSMTGSYDLAISAITGFFVVAIVLGLYGATGPKVEGPAVVPA